MKLLRPSDNSVGARQGHLALIAVLVAACISVSAVTWAEARTIEAQRRLIQALFQDSLQLNAMRLQHRAARHDH